MSTSINTQTVVEFGDTFYLQHKNGQYLVSIDKGRYNFPQLDNIGRVKLQLKGRNNTDALHDGDTIKIRSLENNLGNNDILGAFSDSHNCYYWKDGYDDDKQSWRIYKVSGDKDVIRYGDEIYITNVSYKNQRLVADTKYDGYVTTKENTSDSWIIESAQVKPQLDESDTSNPASVFGNPASVFGLSIASGDPSDQGVILWTRINPEKHDLQKSLKYEVCETNKFDAGVIKGKVEASNFGEETDYTVNVDLHGDLEAGKTYYYRFLYNGVYSKIGRCKTLPTKDTNIDKLRLAVITCNDYSTGYFNAFYHLAEEDVDFVVHLGDFVYEYSQYPPGYGEVYRKDIYWEEDDYGQSPSRTQRATSLENFQQIYRTYRQDLALQTAMEQHTWMITLDDHEVADNWYWNEAEETISIDGHPAGETKEARAKLYNNAIKAWWQYVPARLNKADAGKLEPSDSQEPEILEGLELHQNLIYRRFRFGSLVDFFLTDSRSFRSKPDIDPDNPNPQATMLGEKQKQWLIDGIKNSHAAWKVWGNQTLLATAWLNEIAKPDLIDDWQAYKTERYEILQTIKNSETEKHGTDEASRFVVFTGDMHTSMISYLKTDFEGIRNKANSDCSKLAGVEFMTPSLTSPGVSEGSREAAETWIKKNVPGAATVSQAIEMLPNLPFFSNDSSDGAGEGSKLHKASLAELTKRFSPHIEHYDSSINGYAIAEFTKEKLQWYVYAIDKAIYDKTDDGSNISTNRAEKKLVQAATYNPDGISLDD